MPRSKNRIRECQWCGKEYELGVDSNQHKYCSVECRKAWHYDKWKPSKRDKDTNKGYWLKHKYGITLQEYNSLLKEQSYSCKICKRTEPTGYNWHVDHCHDTGKIRGILCSHCNQAIGLMQDDVSILEEAIKYLNESE